MKSCNVLESESVEKERNVCFDHRLYCDKMADKIRRQALTVQENEELAEVIWKKRQKCNGKCLEGSC